MMMMMMGWMMLFKTQGYILYRPTCRVCPSSPSEVSCAPCALCRPSVLHRQGEMHRDQPASALSRKCEERQAASVFSHPLIIIGMFIQVFVEAFSLTRSQSWCRGNGDVIHPSIRLKRSNYRWRQFAWICFCRPCTWFTVKKNIFHSRIKPGLVYYANHTGKVHKMLTPCITYFWAESTRFVVFVLFPGFTFFHTLVLAHHAHGHRLITGVWEGEGGRGGRWRFKGVTTNSPCSREQQERVLALWPWVLNNSRAGFHVLWKCCREHT